MRRVCLLCSAVLSLVTATSTLSQEPVAQDTGVVLYERYSDTVRVGSPSVFVGLVTAPSGSADPLRLTVFTPPRGADSLCIDLVSDNGWYEGRFGFPRPRSAGRHTVRLPTRLADTLRRYGPHRLAALAYLSRTCSGEQEVILAAGWNPNASPHRLRILLKPTDVEEVHVRPGGTERLFPCTRLREPRQVSFDYTCAVDLSAVRGEHTLSILQRPPIGPRLPPVVVRIWVPDGGA